MQHLLTVQGPQSLCNLLDYIAYSFNIRAWIVDNPLC